MKRRLVFSLFIVLIVLLISLTLVFILLLPLAQEFIVHTYKTVESFEDKQQQVVDQIQNTTVKQQLSSTLSEQKTALVDSYEIISTFVKYSWIIIISLLVIVVYIYARRMVEVRIT